MGFLLILFAFFFTVLIIAVAFWLVLPSFKLRRLLLFTLAMVAGGGVSSRFAALFLPFPFLRLFPIFYRFWQVSSNFLFHIKMKKNVKITSILIGMCLVHVFVSRINQTMEDAAHDVIDITVLFDVISMLGLFAIRVLPGHIGAWCILCPVE